MIIEKQKENDSKIVYLAKINNDKFILNIYIKDKYDNKKDLSVMKIDELKNYSYGDRLSINGKVIIPEILGNIGEFNYKRYLNSKSIIGTISTYNVNYVDNTGNRFINHIFNLRNNISKKIDKYLKPKEANLLKGMLYGDTTGLDSDIKQDFENIGISHITAVSGSNLTIFIVVFTLLLDKKKINKYVHLIIQIFLIAIFCLISNLELSVLRAGVMLIIGIIYKIKNQEICIEKTLIITLVIMLFVNPYRIFNIGMLLSFLATIGIAVFYPKIYNFLESKICWNIKNSVIKKILLRSSLIISITLSANILILPIIINTFNKFPVIFVASNLLISTLSTCINVIGIFTVIVPRIPILSNLSFQVLNILLKLLIHISSVLDKVAINISLRDIPFYITLIYYIYLFFVYLKIKVVKNKIKLKNRIDSIVNSIFLTLVFSICIWVIYFKLFDNYIYYFNVGQGEMAVVKKDNTVIMIDSGSITGDTSYMFDSFAKSTGINGIDILAISHFHSDHINGIEKIMEKYKIKYVMYAYPYDLNSEEYKSFLKYASKYNIKNIVVEAGDRININNISLHVIFPNSQYITVGSNVEENENANSLVLNISSSNKNYLFMGDSIKESERYILEEIQKINISNVQSIKIGHHGSRTSTSDSFIQALNPKYAIISAKKKVYNHPSKEVIDVLNKYGVKIYITEKVGGIKFLGI